MKSFILDWVVDYKTMTIHSPYSVTTKAFDGKEGKITSSVTESSTFYEYSVNQEWARISKEQEIAEKKIYSAQLDNPKTAHNYAKREYNDLIESNFMSNRFENYQFKAEEKAKHIVKCKKETLKRAIVQSTQSFLKAETVNETVDPNIIKEIEKNAECDRTNEIRQRSRKGNNSRIPF